jgi:hypothetical protein
MTRQVSCRWSHHLGGSQGSRACLARRLFQSGRSIQLAPRGPTTSGRWSERHSLALSSRRAPQGSLLRGSRYPLQARWLYLLKVVPTGPLGIFLDPVRRPSLGRCRQGWQPSDLLSIPQGRSSYTLHDDHRTFVYAGRCRPGRAGDDCRVRGVVKIRWNDPSRARTTLAGAPRSPPERRDRRNTRAALELSLWRHKLRAGRSSPAPRRAPGPPRAFHL